jgi:hypothetical protein
VPASVRATTTIRARARNKPVLVPVRTAAPAQAPITLDQAKQHLRVLHDDEDEYIADLIEAATDYLDGYSGVLGKALITQTWRQGFDSFWDGCSYPSALRLPLGPAQSVSAVAYYDPVNSLQTLSASVYELLNDGLGPYVALVAGQSWPAIYSRAARGQRDVGSPAMATTPDRRASPHTHARQAHRWSAIGMRQREVA